MMDKCPSCNRCHEGQKRLTDKERHEGTVKYLIGDCEGKDREWKEWTDFWDRMGEKYNFTPPESTFCFHSGYITEGLE